MSDREKLIDILEDYFGMEMPHLADHLISHGVVVREKGEWEETMEDWVMCSVCGDEWNGKIVPIEDFHYCPNCGADMRKGQNDG